MVLDLDGTLTGTNVMTYITPYYQHFDNLISDNLCVRHTNFYDDSVSCSIILRSILFRNFIPINLIEFSPMKILNLQTPNSSNYGNSTSVLTENLELDAKKSFAVIFAVN